MRPRPSGEINLRVEMQPEEVENRRSTLSSRVAAIIPLAAVRVLD